MVGRTAVRDWDLHSRIVRPLVFGLDAQLRKANGVFEFTHHPQCIFRITYSKAPYAFEFSEGPTVRKGDPVIEMHVWNEQVPRMDGGKLTIGWASRFKRAWTVSFRELCRFLDDRPELDEIQAVWGNMALQTNSDADRMVWLCRGVGLERLADGPPASPIEHAHRFGENVLGLLLALAANPASAKPGILVRNRTPVGISRTSLFRRYGATEPQAA
jgi:hypothetical protein